MHEGLLLSSSVGFSRRDYEPTGNHSEERSVRIKFQKKYRKHYKFSSDFFIYFNNT